MGWLRAPGRGTRHASAPSLPPLAAMSFAGAGPDVARIAPAHGKGHPLGPKRDRDIEAPRGRAPRAPRAAPKAKSNAGALARDMWSRRPGSGSLTRSSSQASNRTSEERRPREESPFTYARVNSLNREVTDAANQNFEMGPMRAVSIPRGDYNRSHALGQEAEINAGMPWVKPAEEPSKPGNPARQNHLDRETKASEQRMEWGPQIVLTSEAGVSHLRRNTLQREEKEGQGLNMPGMRERGSERPASRDNRRTNVLKREDGSLQTLNMPSASGYDAGGVPSYGRKAMLPRAVKAEH